MDITTHNYWAYIKMGNLQERGLQKYVHHIIKLHMNVKILVLFEWSIGYVPIMLTIDLPKVDMFSVA